MKKLSQDDYFQFVAPFLNEINKDPIYTSNNEIAAYLIQNDFRPGTMEFSALKDFFIDELGLQRSVFPILEKKYPPQLLSSISKKPKFPQQDDFVKILKTRRYSWRTIKSYTLSLRTLNIWVLDSFSLEINKLNEFQIMEYFYFLAEKRSVSISLQNVNRSAVLFYFRNILHKKFQLPGLRNTKKQKTLPNVLTRDEILGIISKIHNLKHRLAVSLLYSAGLRIFETVKLRVCDINLENLTIRVNGKGWRQRISIFSKSLLPDLELLIQNKQADDYLFESSQRLGNHLSERSIQKVFSRALEKSGIKRKASCHTLRHSFATHLMENGVDTRFIQKLLGHKNISTTTIYTLVTNPAILKIQSPL